MHDHSHTHSHASDHDHDHSHGHSHRHHDVNEARAHHVFLDLGDGVGALIVQTDRSLLGVEVEISPSGDDASRQHKEVLERTMGAMTVPTLVYDNLPEGEYTLWIDGVAKMTSVRVTSGAVAELDWRTADLALATG
jgi:hypothetical protein